MANNISRKEYLKDFENLKKEIIKFSNNIGHFPAYKDFRKYDYSLLSYIYLFGYNLGRLRKEFGFEAKKNCVFCGKEIIDKTKRHHRMFCGYKCQYSYRKKEYIKKASLWKRLNTEKLILSRKKYSEKNKDKIKEIARIYHQRPEIKEKDKIRAREYGRRPEIKIKRKKYRGANMERERKVRKIWKIKNRKRIADYIRIKNATDPYFNLKHRLRRRLHKALTTYTKTGEIRKSDEYGIDYHETIKKLENDYGKKLTMEYLKGKDIEHTIPLHKFNLNNLEELKRAFGPENTSLMQKELHLKKTSKENSELFSQQAKEINFM